MTDIQDQIEQGPVNPNVNRRGLFITLGVLLGLAVLAGIFGAASTLIGTTRRNENLVPRLLEIYALQPEGGLRYLRVERPGDQILVDDDLPFENTERTFLGPTFMDAAHIAESETYGATLVDVELIDYETGLFAERYTMERDITDGQVLGLEVLFTDHHTLSEDAGRTIFTLPVGPQDAFAQRMIAVAVPRDADVSEATGPEAYRDTRIGGWYVYYFDVTTITAEEIITVAANLTGTTAPETIDRAQFELNR